MLDVVVIGAGQAGLAAAYYLRRAGLDFAVLDAGTTPGGAWVHGWQSLRLFSPRSWSSLPGWQMPGATDDDYPSRNDVIAYFSAYEQRYGFPITRATRVLAVNGTHAALEVTTDTKLLASRNVVSTTGTWENPFVPSYPGRQDFLGEQTHSAHYDSPAAYAGKRVLIIGGGNSGAQITAEVSLVADATWVTEHEPVFLPDDVDGRVLFQRATERWKAQMEGRTIDKPIGGLGDIVMIKSVREARDEGRLRTVRPFESFLPDGVSWPGGRDKTVDAVIWCTGFRPALDHLRPLGVIGGDGRVAVQGARCTSEPRLWLVGYGDWTGAASATIVGVSRAARACVASIEGSLAQTPDA